MTNATTAVSTVFDLQRTVIEQNQAAFKRSLQFQDQAIQAFQDNLESQQAAVSKNAELIEQSIDAYLSAVEDSVPGNSPNFDELRESIREGSDQVDHLQAESWDAINRVVEDAAETSALVTDAYLESADSAFDAYLEAHECVESQVTDVVDVAADAVEIDLEGADEDDA